MMAICGINCSECPCYKGTVSADVDMLASTAKQWSSDQNKYEAIDMACLGCTLENTDLHFTWCKSCEIRECALKKGISNCAACQEFAGCAIIGTHLGRMAGNGSKVPAMMKLMGEKVSLQRKQAAATKSC